MQHKTKSFLRCEEYAALATLSIDGAILDVGGSNKSGYHELIKGEHTFTVGNIDESYGIDIVFDAQERWPFDDASYEGVLMVNLLEHLYRYNDALAEARRVLKPGGTIAGVVPFMFNVHGSPNDYYRYTRSTLERLLNDHGFDTIEVRELGTGAFSVIYHNLIGFVRFNWMARPLMAIARAFDNLLWKIKPHNKMSAEFMPLGYYFEAQRS